MPLAELLITAFAFFGWSLAFSRVAGRRYALMGASLAIFALCHASGVLQYFGIAPRLIILAGSGYAVFATLTRLRTPGAMREFTSLAGAVIGVFLMAYLCARNSVYWAWDEFSHWGTHVEYLGKLGELAADPSLLLFADYLPGMSLWRAFFRAQLPAMGSAAAYFADGVLVFSCLHLLVQDRKPLDAVIGGLALIALWIVFFQSLVISLLVDQVQAILLMTGLAMVTLGAPLPMLALVIAALAASKHVGLLFALAVAAYRGTQIFARPKMPAYRTITDTLVLVGVAAAVHTTWQVFVWYHAIAPSFPIAAAGDRLRDAASLAASLGRTLELMFSSVYPHAAWVRYPWAPPFELQMPVFLLIGSSMLIALVAGRDENRRQAAIDLAFAVAFLLLYFLFLAITWTAIGYQIEKYSFVRYLSVPMMGLTGFLCWRRLNAPRCDTRMQVALCTAAVCTAALVTPPLSALAGADKPGLALDQESRRILAAIRERSSITDIIGFVDEPELSMNYFILRSLIIPQRLAPPGWLNRRQLIFDFSHAILANPALRPDERVTRLVQAGRFFSIRHEEFAEALGVTVADIDDYLDPKRGLAGDEPGHSRRQPSWRLERPAREPFEVVLCRVDWLFANVPATSFWNENRGHFDTTRPKALYRVENDGSGRCVARLAWAMP
jgi:hypothetical protein